MHGIQSIAPELSVVEHDPDTLAKIKEVETQVEEAVSLIMGAKLSDRDVTKLKYVPQEVLTAIAEHCIAASTLKHALHKARNRRISDIKKGL